jgi:hypothetical protein
MRLNKRQRAFVISPTVIYIVPSSIHSSKASSSIHGLHSPGTQERCSLDYRPRSPACNSRAAT